ncbi:phospholipase D-like domain-containing protein [Akkermansiaceae bacterium]|nr:phospholipase D-like domain-containing protein [Akkermansiaceae bacterium]MDG1669888.1 phospholipase D-like domain-containing protein [Akkermansiaceae bacterium]
MPVIDLVLNEDIHQRVIVEMLPRAERYLWIVTADLKDLHVKKGRRFVPLLEILSDLVNEGVAVRLFHAKEPGPRFREDFDRYPSLIESDLFERILCPRIHTKTIIVDGKEGFIGSANLTGAGVGAKSPLRRNFEAGFVTDEKKHLGPMMEWIDQLYLGEFCQNCQRRETCPDPIA